jgi:hypothetical protein
MNASPSSISEADVAEQATAPSSGRKSTDLNTNLSVRPRFKLGRLLKRRQRRRGRRRRKLRRTLTVSSACSCHSILSVSTGTDIPVPCLILAGLSPLLFTPLSRSAEVNAFSYLPASLVRYLETMRDRGSYEDLSSSDKPESTFPLFISSSGRARLADESLYARDPLVFT